MIKKIVHVVLKGEQGEGGTVCGVFRELEKAVEHAEKTPTSYEPWYAPDEPPDERVVWERYSGCDFVIIERWEVQ